MSPSCSRCWVNLLCSSRTLPPLTPPCSAAGRFGYVWAYVIEVLDETDVAIVERRKQSRWEDLRDELATMAASAATSDEFLQVAVNPHRDDDGTHQAYVTRHVMRAPGHPTDPAREPQHVHVSGRCPHHRLRVGLPDAGHRAGR